MERTTAQRIVEAAAVLPAYGGVTGWAALHWMGGYWFSGTELDGVTERDVVLATSCADIRPQPGIRVSAERLDPSELMVVDGLRVTVPARSVLFEMRYARSQRAAVAFADMAAYNDLASLDEIAAVMHNGMTGNPRARTALTLADENSWSLWETIFRTYWMEAGLPRPLCNAPIFDRSGAHIGTPDLLDPVAGLVGEYDGALHLEGQQRIRDRERDERYRSHGLGVVTMMQGDSADPDRLMNRILAAYQACRTEDPATRSWTAEPPSWWLPSTTVAERRSLREQGREDLLRLRRHAG